MKKHLKQSIPLAKYLALSIYFASSILFFIQCTTKEDNTESVSIDLNESSVLNVALNHDGFNAISLSEYPSVMGQISKLVLTDELAIVYDGELKSVNLKNKEIIQLAKKGNGPFEYLTVTSVKTSDSGIYFLDQRQMKLTKVSWNGDPVFEINIDSHPLDFHLLNDSLVALFHGSHPLQDSSYRVSVFNMNTKSHTSKYIPFPGHHFNFLNLLDWTNFSTYNNTTLLSFSGSNAIYKFNEHHELTPMMNLDFGERNLTPEMLDKDYNEIIEFAQEMDPKGIIYKIGSLYETEHHILFSTRTGRDWYLCSYDKNTGKTKVFDSISINSSAPTKITYDLTPRGFINGQLAFIVEAATVIDSPGLSFALSQTGINMQEITQMSNPFILLINEEIIQ